MCCAWDGSLDTAGNVVSLLQLVTLVHLQDLMRASLLSSKLTFLLYFLPPKHFIQAKYS
jgi:hypothetical protein